MYSRSLKFSLSKTELFEDQISNGPVLEGLGFNSSYCPHHLKTRPFKTWIFVPISNGLSQNCGHLYEFQMVGLLDFRSHLKSRPFLNQPIFDYYKSSRSGFQIPTVHLMWLHLFPDSRQELKVAKVVELVTSWNWSNDFGHELRFLLLVVTCWKKSVIFCQILTKLNKTG